MSLTITLSGGRRIHEPDVHEASVESGELVFVRPPNRFWPSAETVRLPLGKRLPRFLRMSRSECTSFERDAASELTGLRHWSLRPPEPVYAKAEPHVVSWCVSGYHPGRSAVCTTRSR
jgi:hypothetical protein